MGEYEDWLGGLKVQDKVAISKNGSFSIGTVTKITPTGQVQVDGYEPKYKNGMIRYDSFNTSRIIPVTEEIKEYVYRKVAIYKILTANFDDIPTDRLREIRKIIDGKT